MQATKVIRFNARQFTNFILSVKFKFQTIVNKLVAMKVIVVYICKGVIYKHLRPLTT